MKYLQNYKMFEKTKQSIKRVSEEEIEKEKQKEESNLIDNTNPHEPVKGIKAAPTNTQLP